MQKKNHKVVMLGTGLIGTFYTMCIQQNRSNDYVHTVYSRTGERAQKFAADWNIPHYTTDMIEAINDPEADLVVIGLPNHMHLEIVEAAARAGKGILCTKPLGRNAAEAKQMLDIVEKAGVFHGYLEDLAYTPKTLKATKSIRNGAIGRVTWARSREAHPGPHSDWFWDIKQAGGGAILDIGCHCIEISRNFIGKDVRPLEVICWADTLVKPIEAEDNAIGIVKYANGAIGQFEVSWSYRGGLDIRDEVDGTDGTIRLDHFLRAGMEMFTAVGEGEYIAEKAELNTGWLFAVGDELNALGYNHMFADMFNSMDKGQLPMESFYDGYIVNAIMDACYKSAKSKQWESVEIEDWRGSNEMQSKIQIREFDESHLLIKEELLPDGRKKIILKHKQSGRISEKVM